MSVYESIRHGTSAFPIGVHDTRYGDGFRLYPHTHREFEFLIVERGMGTMYIDDMEYPIGPGQAVFVRSGDLHLGLGRDMEPCEFFALVFAPEFLAIDGNDIVFQNYVMPVLDRTIKLPTFYSGEQSWEAELIQRTRKVCRLNNERPLGYELSIKAEMLEIWRLAFERGERGVKGRASAAKDMITAMEYIRSEFASPLTLKDIAGRVNMSQGYFCRRFSSVMHITPFEYLLQIRVDNSCRLLRGTDLPVGEIALRCGFNGFSYFTKKFSQLVGCTPLEFRKSRQQCDDMTVKTTG